MSEFFCPALDSTRKSDSTANYYPAVEASALVRRDADALTSDALRLAYRVVAGDPCA